MEGKTIVSSRGQVVIPKLIREALGIHSGSELFLSVREDQAIVLTPIHRDIRDFFGKGTARMKGEVLSLEDIDAAIAEAVVETNIKK